MKTRDRAPALCAAGIGLLGAAAGLSWLSGWQYDYACFTASVLGALVLLLTLLYLLGDKTAAVFSGVPLVLAGAAVLAVGSLQAELRCQICGIAELIFGLGFLLTAALLSRSKK